MPTQLQSCKNLVEKHVEIRFNFPQDISGSNAEPLKRSENAEIRCVLMCHSEIERNCVFEAVAKV